MDKYGRDYAIDIENERKEMEDANQSDDIDLYKSDPSIALNKDKKEAERKAEEKARKEESEKAVAEYLKDFNPKYIDRVPSEMTPEERHEYYMKGREHSEPNIDVYSEVVAESKIVVGGKEMTFDPNRWEADFDEENTIVYVSKDDGETVISAEDYNTFRKMFYDKFDSKLNIKISVDKTNLDINEKSQVTDNYDIGAINTDRVSKKAVKEVMSYDEVKPDFDISEVQVSQEHEQTDTKSNMASETTKEEETFVYTGVTNDTSDKPKAKFKSSEVVESKNTPPESDEKEKTDDESSEVVESKNTPSESDEKEKTEDYTSFRLPVISNFVEIVMAAVKDTMKSRMR